MGAITIYLWIARLIVILLSYLFAKTITSRGLCLTALCILSWHLEILALPSKQTLLLLSELRQIAVETEVALGVLACVACYGQESVAFLAYRSADVVVVQQTPRI